MAGTEGEAASYYITQVTVTYHTRVGEEGGRRKREKPGNPMLLEKAGNRSMDSLSDEDGGLDAPLPHDDVVVVASDLADTRKFRLVVDYCLYNADGFMQ